MSITWVGDAALRRVFEGAPARANALARAAASAVARAALPEVADVVAAARSVVVHLRAGAEPGRPLWDALSAEREPADGPTAVEHVVRTEYGGPDLAAVARHAGVPEREAVAVHAGARYTVAFIGFTPGFPYLAGLPAALAIPRHATPRPRVEAGSVGIGGPYTGVYPRATPGGWHVIGRTDVALFDPARGALMAPGDRVRFVAS